MRNILITLAVLASTNVFAKTAEIPVTIPINYALVTVDNVRQDVETFVWSVDIKFTGPRGFLMTNVAPNARSERFVMAMPDTEFTDEQMQAVLGADYAGFVAATGYGLTVAVDPVKEKIIDAVIWSITQ